MKVAACFITKNEEACLARAIESLKNIADEIIVVDTGSTDKTTEIAKRYTDRLYSFPWQDDFAKAKNYAIAKAQADWIIFIDADEYFKPGCAEAVRGYMEKYLATDVEGLGCKKINIDSINNNVMTAIPETRIFKGSLGISYEGMIHEHLVKDGRDLRIIFLGDEVILYHTGYSSNIVVAKLERNLRILNKEIKLLGIKPLHYRYLCDCYLKLGEIYFRRQEAGSALEYYVRALQLDKYLTIALQAIINILGDTKECISVLNCIYDKHNLLEMTFLEHSLENMSIGSIYIYYQKYFPNNEISSKKHQMYLQAAMKNLQGVDKLTDEVLTDYQNRLFYCCLTDIKAAVDNNDEISLPQNDELADDYKKILEYIYSERSNLPNTCQEALVSFLKWLGHGNGEYTSILLKTITFASFDLKLYVADMLMEQERYTEAAEVYKLADEKAMSVMQIENKAIALFKQQRYCASQACFARAELKGSLTKRGQEFYNWSKAKKDNYKAITSIVILTYNQLNYTKLCIESIRQKTPADTYEIIVVDNNSIDGTVEWLKQQNDLQVIFNAENNGFPKGCNQGIEVASGQQILLLNNDTIVSEGWLSRLNTALYSDIYTGAVGAVSNSCTNYQSINIAYESLADMDSFAQQVANLNAGHYENRARLIGFCLLIKRCVIDEIGVLDEIFTPGNYEDDDYSCRLKLAGYELKLCRDVFIHHFGHVSFNPDRESNAKFLRLLQRNELIFKKKWGYSEIQIMFLHTIGCFPAREDFLAALLNEALTYNNASSWRHFKECLAVAAYPASWLYLFIVNICMQKRDFRVKVDFIVKIAGLLPKNRETAFLIEAYKNNYRSEELVQKLTSLLADIGKHKVVENIISECEAQFNGNEAYGLNKECIEDISLPLVSILIPTYNRLEMFQEAFQSALAQTYPNIEIIVCDNSTNESTFAYMQLFKNHPKVKYVRNRMAKQKSDNFLPFKELAQGEYIQWLMDDDVMATNKLQIMSEVLRENPQVTLVTSYRAFIDQTGKIIPNTYKPLKNQSSIMAGAEIGRYELITMRNDIGEPSAVLFRKKDLQNHYWRAACRDYKIISDVAMWLELLEKGNLAYIIEPLSSFRKHAQQEQNDANVYVAARNEWFRLAAEYYERKIYIKNSDEYNNFLGNFLIDNEEVERTLLEKQAEVEPMILAEYRENIRLAHSVQEQSVDI